MGTTNILLITIGSTFVHQLDLVRDNHVVITGALGVLVLIASALVGFLWRIGRRGLAAAVALADLLFVITAAVVAYPAMQEQDAVLLGAAVLLLAVVGGVVYGGAPERESRQRRT